MSELAALQEQLSAAQDRLFAAHDEYRVSDDPTAVTAAHDDVRSIQLKIDAIEVAAKVPERDGVEALMAELAEAERRYQQACIEYEATKNEEPLRAAKQAVDDLQTRLGALKVATQARRDAREIEEKREREERWSQTKKDLRAVLGRQHGTAEEITDLIQKIVRTYARFQDEKSEAAKLLQPWRLHHRFVDLMTDMYAQKINAALCCTDGGIGTGGPFRPVMQYGGTKSFMWDSALERTFTQFVDLLHAKVYREFETMETP